MIINLNGGYAKTSKFEDNKLQNTEEPLPPNLEEYNALYKKGIEITAKINELERQKSQITLEMAEKLIYPYKFGDRVTVTICTVSHYGDYLYHNTYRGVIDFDLISKCLCISDINKDGSVSSRPPHKLNYIPNIKVTDYEK